MPKAYIFFMEKPTYKEMFFGCPDHERKCVLLTLMSRPKNYKSGIFWPTLVLEWIMLFCLVLAWLITGVFFFKRYLFALLDNIYFVENKYVMRELLYNIEIYITCFLATIIFFSLMKLGDGDVLNYQIHCKAYQPKKIQSKTSSP